MIIYLKFSNEYVNIPSSECKGGVSMRPKKEADAHKIIKAMRFYLGMTQEEAAKRCGISLCVYQKYENIPGELFIGSDL